jgi:AraC-like DNA-binding protein
MNELYDIIALFATGGMFLTCGLAFIFIYIPANPLLRNYRMARYVMAFAYLMFVPGLAAEYVFRDAGNTQYHINQALTLGIAALQAFLFTVSLLALLDVARPGYRSLFRLSAPAILFMTAVFVVYVFCREAILGTAFYVFSGIYVLLLVYFTVWFLVRYRLFRFRLDNYYSDDETKRLRWVVFSFFAALSVGIMALVSVVFMSVWVALLFSIVYDMFYLYFAFRFISYPHLFQTIEGAMSSEAPEDDPAAEYKGEYEGKDKSEYKAENKPEYKPEYKGEYIGEYERESEGESKTDENNLDTTGLSPSVVAVLEQTIEQWVAAGGFTQKGITIHVLAMQCNTNGKYLSRYINNRHQMTFREWINRLRIEEAKKMMLQNPEMKISEISDKMGFSDRSNFHRLFVAATNSNPAAWRKKNTE